MNEHSSDRLEDGHQSPTSHLSSPDKKKMDQKTMKIRGDCFLYTSFYMIKKWFLVLVAIRNLPQFQKSMQQMFKFETKDKWFVVGVICALPVLIPVAALFIALGLLLLLLLILTFILAVILLFVLIFIIDMPLLIVLTLQGCLLAATLSDLDPIVSVDFEGFLVYLQIAFMVVMAYNALDEVSNACDNMLFMDRHYKERKEMSRFYGFFIFMSVLPQILQIAVAVIVSYFSPQVLLSSDDIIAAIRNFAGLYIIIKANTFMVAFLRETKWHSLHWILFKYLEDNKKVNLIHVKADEVNEKIDKLKMEKVYQYRGFGVRYDQDYKDDLCLYIFRWIIKFAILVIFVAVFFSNLSNFYGWTE